MIIIVATTTIKSICIIVGSEDTGAIQVFETFCDKILNHCSLNVIYNAGIALLTVY